MRSYSIVAGFLLMNECFVVFLLFSFVAGIVSSQINARFQEYNLGRLQQSSAGGGDQSHRSRCPYRRRRLPQFRHDCPSSDDFGSRMRLLSNNHNVLTGFMLFW